MANFCNLSFGKDFTEDKIKGDLKGIIGLLESTESYKADPKNLSNYIESQKWLEDDKQNKEYATYLKDFLWGFLVGNDGNYLALDRTLRKKVMRAINDIEISDSSTPETPGVEATDFAVLYDDISKREDVNSKTVNKFKTTSRNYMRSAIVLNRMKTRITDLIMANHFFDSKTKTFKNENNVSKTLNDRKIELCKIIFKELGITDYDNIELSTNKALTQYINTALTIANDRSIGRTDEFYSAFYELANFDEILENIGLTVRKKNVPTFNHTDSMYEMIIESENVFSKTFDEDTIIDADDTVGNFTKALFDYMPMYNPSFNTQDSAMEQRTRNAATVLNIHFTEDQSKVGWHPFKLMFTNFMDYCRSYPAIYQKLIDGEFEYDLSTSLLDDRYLDWCKALFQGASLDKGKPQKYLSFSHDEYDLNTKKIHLPLLMLDWLLRDDNKLSKYAKKKYSQIINSFNIIYNSAPHKIRDLVLNTISKIVNYKYLEYEFNYKKGTVEQKIKQERPVVSSSSKLSNDIAARITQFSGKPKFFIERMQKAFESIELKYIKANEYHFRFKVKGDSKLHTIIVNIQDVNAGGQSKYKLNFSVTQDDLTAKNSTLSLKSVIDIIYNLYSHKFNLPNTAEELKIADEYLSNLTENNIKVSPLHVFKEIIGIPIFAALTSGDFKSIDEFNVGREQDPFLYVENHVYRTKAGKEVTIDKNEIFNIIAQPQKVKTNDSVNLKWGNLFDYFDSGKQNIKLNLYFQDYDVLSSFMYWLTGYDNKNVVKDAEGNNIPLQSLVSSIFDLPSFVYRIKRDSEHILRGAGNPLAEGSDNFEFLPPIIKNKIKIDTGIKKASKLNASESFIINTFIDFNNSFLEKNNNEYDITAYQKPGYYTVFLQPTVNADKDRMFIFPVRIKENSTIGRALKGILNYYNTTDPSKIGELKKGYNEHEDNLINLIYNWQHKKYQNSFWNTFKKYHTVLSEALFQIKEAKIFISKGLALTGKCAEYYKWFNSQGNIDAIEAAIEKLIQCEVSNSSKDPNDIVLLNNMSYLNVFLSLMTSDNLRNLFKIYNSDKIDYDLQLIKNKNKGNLLEFKIDLTEELDYSFHKDSGKKTLTYNRAIHYNIQHVFNSAENTKNFFELQKRILIDDIKKDNVHLYTDTLNIELQPNIKNNKKWVKNKEVLFYRIYDSTGEDVTDEIYDTSVLFTKDVNKNITGINTDYTIELNPIVLASMYFDGIASQSFMEVFFGLEENKGSKSHGFGLVNNASRYLMQLKRNVPMGSTVHKLQQGRKFGVYKEMLIAACEDPAFEYAMSVVGEVFDEEPFNGSGFESPIHKLYEDASYTGAGKDSTRSKSLFHDVRNGNGELLKWATFVITNRLRRISPKYNHIPVEDMFRKMHSIKLFSRTYNHSELESGLSNWISLVNETLKKNIIYEQDIYSGNYKRLKSLELIKDNNGNAVLKKNYILTNEFCEAKSDELSSYLAMDESVTMYDIDQFLGGAYSFGYSEKGFVETNFNNMACAQLLVCLNDTIKSKENRDFRTKIVAYLINQSGFKAGPQNLNNSTVFTNPDESLSTSVISTQHGGIMLTSEHEVDSSVKEPTQIFSSLTQNGYSQKEVNIIQKNISTIVSLCVNDLAKKYNINNKNGRAAIEKALIRAMSVSKRKGLTSNDMLKVFVESDSKERLEISFSLPDLQNKFFSIVNSFLTKEAVITRYPGGQEVNAPGGVGMIQYYTYKDQKYTYDTFVKKLLEDRNENGLEECIAKMTALMSMSPMPLDESKIIKSAVDYYLRPYKVSYGKDHNVRSVELKVPDTDELPLSMKKLYGEPGRILDLDEITTGTTILVERSVTDEFGFAKNVYEEIWMESPSVRDKFIYSNFGPNGEILSNITNVWINTASPSSLKQPIFSFNIQYTDKNNNIRTKTLTAHDLDGTRALYTYKYKAARVGNNEEIAFSNGEVNFINKVLEKILNLDPKKYRYVSSLKNAINAQGVDLYTFIKQPKNSKIIVKTLMAYNQTVMSMFHKHPKIDASNDEWNTVVGWQRSFALFTDMAPGSINYSIQSNGVSPGECAMSPAYARMYGIRPTDDLGEILKPSNGLNINFNFFKNRLIENSTVSASNDKYDIRLRSNDGQTVLLKVGNGQIEDKNVVFSDEGLDLTGRYVVYNGIELDITPDEWANSGIKIGKIWDESNSNSYNYIYFTIGGEDGQFKIFKELVDKEIFDLKFTGFSDNITNSARSDSAVKGWLINFYYFLWQSTKKEENWYKPLTTEKGVGLDIKDKNITEVEFYEKYVKGNFRQVTDKIVKMFSADDYIDKLAGKLASSFEKSLMYVATRIPSQALQSGMALKVVMFAGWDDNLVYIPGAMHWFQGADYDIDKSFMLRLGITDGKLNVLSNLADDYDIQDCINLPIPNNNCELSVNRYGTRDIVNIRLERKEYQYVDGVYYIDKNWAKDMTNEKRFEMILKILDYHDNFVYDKDFLNISFVDFENNTYQKDSVLDKELDLLVDHINKHNKTSLRNKKKVQEALKNKNVLHVYNIMLDPRNYINSSNPVAMGEIAEYAKKSALGGREKWASIWNPYTKYIMQEQMALGKSEIGVVATAIKTYLTKNSVANSNILSAVEIIQNGIDIGKDTEEGRALIKNGLDIVCNLMFVINRDGGENSFGILANVNLEPLNDVLSELGETYDLNGIPSDSNLTKLEAAGAATSGVLDVNAFIDKINESNANEDVLMALSALLTAATDNAKELVLKKINASMSTVDLFCSMLAQGYSIGEILDVFSNPLFELTDKFSQINLFDRSEDNKRNLNEIIDFVTGNKIPLNSRYHRKLVELLNCDEFLCTQERKGSLGHDFILSDVDPNDNNLLRIAMFYRIFLYTVGTGANSTTGGSIESNAKVLFGTDDESLKDVIRKSITAGDSKINGYNAIVKFNNINIVNFVEDMLKDNVKFDEFKNFIITNIISDGSDIFQKNGFDLSQIRTNFALSILNSGGFKKVKEKVSELFEIALLNERAENSTASGSNNYDEEVDHDSFEYSDDADIERLSSYSETTADYDDIMQEADWDAIGNVVKKIKYRPVKLLKLTDFDSKDMSIFRNCFNNMQFKNDRIKTIEDSEGGTKLEEYKQNLKSIKWIINVSEENRQLGKITKVNQGLVSRDYEINSLFTSLDMYFNRELSKHEDYKDEQFSIIRFLGNDAAYRNKFLKIFDKIKYQTNILRVLYEALNFNSRFSVYKESLAWAEHQAVWRIMSDLQKNLLTSIYGTKNAIYRAIGTEHYKAIKALVLEGIQFEFLKSLGLTELALPDGAGIYSSFDSLNSQNNKRIEEGTVFSVPSETSDGTKTISLSTLEGCASFKRFAENQFLDILKNCNLKCLVKRNNGKEEEMQVSQNDFVTSIYATTVYDRTLKEKILSLNLGIDMINVESSIMTAANFQSVKEGFDAIKDYYIDMKNGVIIAPSDVKEEDVKNNKNLLTIEAFMFIYNTIRYKNVDSKFSFSKLLQSNVDKDWSYKEENGVKKESNSMVYRWGKFMLDLDTNKGDAAQNAIRSLVSDAMVADAKMIMAQDRKGLDILNQQIYNSEGTLAVSKITNSNGRLIGYVYKDEGPSFVYMKPYGDFVFRISKLAGFDPEQFTDGIISPNNANVLLNNVGTEGARRLIDIFLRRIIGDSNDKVKMVYDIKEDDVNANRVLHYDENNTLIINMNAVDEYTSGALVFMIVDKIPKSEKLEKAWTAIKNEVRKRTVFQGRYRGYIANNLTEQVAFDKAFKDVLVHEADKLPGLKEIFGNDWYVISDNDPASNTLDNVIEKLLNRNVKKEEITLLEIVKTIIKNTGAKSVKLNELVKNQAVEESIKRIKDNLIKYGMLTIKDC